MLISELTTGMIEEGLALIKETESNDDSEYKSVAAFAFTKSGEVNISADTKTFLFDKIELEAELKRRNDASIHTS